MIQRPNIVLLTVECWRGDHYGSITPHLRELARESALFTDAYAAGGWTRISMTALMSSAYASLHGGSSVALATPARKVLAECLLENGYWTAGYTANLSCGSIAGFHRGFGEYRDGSRKLPLPPGAPADWKEEWPQLLEMGIPPRDIAKSIDGHDLTDLGIRWLSRHEPDAPYFLWLHYMDPHWPCQMATRPGTPAELRDAWNDVNLYRNTVIPSHGTFDPGEETRARWATRYRESITSTDREIGRLLETLRARPDWGRTVVVVCGDHGEEFFERGTWHHSWNQLHREGIQIPLIIRAPADSPKTIDRAVSLLDIAPTLLELAGVEKPASMMGTSLCPDVRGEVRSSRPVISEMMGHLDSVLYRLAIREGDWSYIYNCESPFDSLLFNVADDPAELVNLRDIRRDIFRRFEQMRLCHMASTLGSHMEKLKAGGNSRDSTPPGKQKPFHLDDAAGDDLIREQLEALGYV